MMRQLDKMQVALDYMVDETRNAGNDAIDVDGDDDVDNDDVFTIMEAHRFQLQVGDTDGDGAVERATYHFIAGTLVRRLEQRSGDDWVADDAVPTAIFISRVKEFTLSYLDENDAATTLPAALRKVRMKVNAHYANRLDSDQHTVDLEALAGIRMSAYRRDLL